jgi:hypothetical protein
MKCAVLGILSLCMLTGCAARMTGFRTIVSPNCLTAPLVMKDCVFVNGLTQCRAVEVKYRTDCAQIQARKGSPPK